MFNLKINWNYTSNDDVSSTAAEYDNVEFTHIHARTHTHHQVTSPLYHLRMSIQCHVTVCQHAGVLMRECVSAVPMR